MTVEEKNDIINRDSYELPNNVLNAVPQPMVSIRTATFQHVDYIKECIEGVLAQKTSFLFEYLIGDDFSTDGTREIVFDYAKRYPDIIRVITADYNMYHIKGNSSRLKQNCRGNYIAICEGDDYWTDPYKLQKQVEFLEAHPDYGMVHTDFDSKDIKTGKITKAVIARQNPKDKWQGGANFVQWYVGGYAKIITCTICFRKSVYDEHIEEGLKDNIFGDIRLFCTIGGNSKVKYMKDVTVVKNNLPESASQSQDVKKKILIHTDLANAFEFYGKKYKVQPKYYKRFKNKSKRRIIKMLMIKKEKQLLSEFLLNEHKLFKWGLRVVYPLVSLVVMLKKINDK